MNYTGSTLKVRGVAYGIHPGTRNQWCGNIEDWQSHVLIASILNLRCDFDIHGPVGVQSMGKRLSIPRTKSVISVGFGATVRAYLR